MSSPLIHSPLRQRAGFTLIELLTVIAIIGILASITFGVMRGVNQRASINKARTELASLAQALEAYKKQYGDYPQTGASVGTPSATATDSTVEGQLFNALMGKYGPKLDKIQGKQFLEASKYNLQTTNLPTPGNTTTVNNAFLDPWDRLYIYYYRTAGSPGTWKQPSYILMSAGPDGNMGINVQNDGSFTEQDTTQSADNIYANR